MEVLSRFEFVLIVTILAIVFYSVLALKMYKEIKEADKELEENKKIKRRRKKK